MPVTFIDPEKPNKHWNLMKAVLQAKFPDVLDRVNTSIEEDTAPGNADGSYDLRTNKIRIVLPSSRADLTTPRLMELIDTAMHEMVHAERNTKAAADTEEDRQEPAKQGRKNIVDFWDTFNALSDKAIQEKLPSVSKYNTSREEIMATAQSVSMLNDRNIYPDYTDNIARLKQLPGVADWIARNNMPQTATLKSGATFFQELGDYIRQKFSP